MLPFLQQLQGPLQLLGYSALLPYVPSSLSGEQGSQTTATTIPRGLGKRTQRAPSAIVHPSLLKQTFDARQSCTLLATLPGLSQCEQRIPMTHLVHVRI